MQERVYKGKEKNQERSFEGRSQWLVPVEWKDGWPTIPNDPDGNGIGNTVAGWEKPIQGHPIAAPQTDDQFDGEHLGHQWQWNHNPRNDRWSLMERPGWLRIYAGKPQRGSGFWRAANTLSQRLMGTGKGDITAKLDVSGMVPGQVAGFCRHSGKYVLLGVEMTHEGKRLFFDNNGTKRLVGPVLKNDVFYVRSQNYGRTATLYYSLDNKTWTQLGPEFMITFGRWRGDRPGFFTWNKQSDAKLGYLDIDWFKYDYDGPK